MITCTRRLDFCAGHRVMNHENKCKNMHGHQYSVLITCHAKGLDKLGRVIDFSCIKHLIGAWIDEHWDHGFIYWDQDHEVREALKHISGQKIFELTQNPTAENMADFLLTVICPVLLEPCGVVATNVQLWETPNCYATATVEGVR